MASNPIEAMVEGVSGAAFAVDAGLKVIAWNRAAERGLGTPASAALGHPCYEVIAAVDVASGLPCLQRCPLAQGTNAYVWAHNRLLRAPWAGGRPVRLDCFLLRCNLPESFEGALCFVGPPASEIETHSRILETLEAVFPAVARSGDPRDALRSVLQSSLVATGASVAALYALDPQSQQLVPLEQVGAPPEPVDAALRTLLRQDMADHLLHARLPTLIVGRKERGDRTEEPVCALCIPLRAEEHVLGGLVVAAFHRGWNVAMAARILFPVAIQLSVYLRWAYTADAPMTARTSAQESEARARLRFYCLGTFRMMVDGAPASTEPFHRMKAVNLLKYLVAHRGRPIAREKLIEVLWPEADPLRGGNNLRVVLYDLRHALQSLLPDGPTLVNAEGDLVYLDASARVWVDVEEFSRCARRAEMYASSGDIAKALEECRRATSLYAGDFMEEEPYGEWCLAEREQLSELYINLLQREAILLEAQGKRSEAIDLLRRVLHIDPVREEVHRRLMRMFWEAGRRDEAMRQYGFCRAALRREIETDPSPETQSLYRAIASGAAPVRQGPGPRL